MTTMSKAVDNGCPSTLPPVITTNYTIKGAYEQINGLKTYTTGSASSTRGIILVYDIFGLRAQTLQGADRLAASLAATVLVPDFFDGETAREEWYGGGAPKDEAMVAEEARFRAKMADFGRVVEVLEGVVRAARERFPLIEGWGVFGLCWGGKIAALASGSETLFRVSGQAHPARPTREDAEAMTIPHICLAAPSDNKDGGIDAYEEVLKQEGRIGEVETYSTMFHGWMGARAKLEDKENAKEFERGYNQVAVFFAKHL